jgi:hypothetical protein
MEKIPMCEVSAKTKQFGCPKICISEKVIAASLLNLSFDK